MNHWNAGHKYCGKGLEGGEALLLGAANVENFGNFVSAVSGGNGAVSGESAVSVENAENVGCAGGDVGGVVVVGPGVNGEVEADTCPP